MMLLICGENTVASRNYLNEVREEAKKAGKEVINFDPKLAASEFMQAVSGNGLFGNENLVLVEGLFKSKTGANIIKYLIENPDTNVVLWEEGKVNKTATNKLKIEIKEFELRSELFSFLEALKPGNQRVFLPMWEKLIGVEAVEMIMFMIIRQWKSLILAKEGVFSGPSWLQGKLKGQANAFVGRSLIDLHGELYEIDRYAKTGGKGMSLEQELEMWLIKL